MANLLQIIARANALKNETALDSISPGRAGGIMYDTLLYINEMQLQESNPLLISKIYASVEAMEADSAPVSDLTGRPLRAGQVVCIVTGDPDDADEGVIYRYNGTTQGTSSWTAVGRIGSDPYLEGYLYMGIATPTTDPGIPTQKVFYLATTPGTYQDLGGLVVNDGEVAILKWDTDWSKDVTGAATAAQMKDVDSALLKITPLTPADYIVGAYPRKNGTLSPSPSAITNVYDVSGLSEILISGKTSPEGPEFDYACLVMFATAYSPLAHVSHILQPQADTELYGYKVDVPAHTGTLYALILTESNGLHRFSAGVRGGYYVIGETIKKYTEENVEPLQNAVLKLKPIELADTIPDVYPRTNLTLSSLPGYTTGVYDVSDMEFVYVSSRARLQTSTVALVMFASSYSPLSVVELISQPTFSGELYGYKVAVPPHNGTLYALVLAYGPSGTIFSLNSDDGNFVIGEMTENQKTINCAGDSITQGQKGIINLREGTVSTSRNSYTNELQILLGPDFDIMNYGYGGNMPADIFTAVGLESIILTQQVTLKADGTPSAINDISDPVDSASGEIVSAYLTQFATTEAENAQTYCEVFGIPCKISRSDDTMFIARREAGGSDFIIPSGTNVYMDGVQDKDAIYVVYVGRNNITFYAQTQNFVKYMRTIVSAISSGRYLVIGEKATSDSDLASLTPTNEALEAEFGPRFINLQKELCNYAIFERLGYEPTEDSFFSSEQLSHGVDSDVDLIASGIVPVSFWREVYGVGDYTTNDKVHMSRLGYKALALLVADRIQQLGW